MKGVSNWVNVTRNKSETFDGLSIKSKESSFAVNGLSFFKEPQHSASNEDICFAQHLNELYRKDISRVILTYINTNSICYRFHQLFYGIEGKVDVLMLTETKLDHSFPTVQFSIEGY